MGSKSDYLENAILDHMLGGPDYVRPITVYAGLFTSLAVDGSGGTEVASINNYSRLAIVNDNINFPPAVNGVKQLAVAHSFPEASGTWGTVVAVVIFDAATGGNRLMWDDFTGIPVVVGTLLSYGPGGITVTEM